MDAWHMFDGGQIFVDMNMYNVERALPNYLQRYPVAALFRQGIRNLNPKPLALRLSGLAFNPQTILVLKPINRYQTLNA